MQNVQSTPKSPNFHGVFENWFSLEKVNRNFKYEKLKGNTEVENIKTCAAPHNNTLSEKTLLIFKALSLLEVIDLLNHPVLLFRV